MWELVQAEATVFLGGHLENFMESILSMASINIHIIYKFFMYYFKKSNLNIIIVRFKNDNIVIPCYVANELKHTENAKYCILYENENNIFYPMVYKSQYTFLFIIILSSIFLLACHNVDVILMYHLECYDRQSQEQQIHHPNTEIKSFLRSLFHFSSLA